MRSIPLIADAEIPAANLLLKIGSTTRHCAICGAGDSPVGISTGHVRSGYIASVQAIESGVVDLVSAGAIARGAVVEIAANGRVETYSSGLKIGFAATAAASAGDPVAVSVNIAAIPIP